LDSGRNIVSRLVWLVLVLVSIAVALYQIQDRIIYYSLYPTSSDVTLVDAEKLRFPQVTICNENRVSRSVAEQYGRT